MSRRFIAGATCPDCRQLDTIYVVVEPQVMIQRCTRCDFTARLWRTEDGGPPAPPASRDDAPQAVRILDPGASKSS